MIFVDTSAWVAIEDRRDIHHLEALRFKRELVASRSRLVTTNHVLDETFTLLLLDVGYVQTVSFKYSLDELTANHLVVVLHVASEMEREGWEVFERFNSDKTWSFTDCISKVAMERMGIVEAFTFDHHFSQMGFEKRPL